MQQSHRSFLGPLAADSDTPFALVRPADAVVVAARLDGAFKSSVRRRGLLGRDSLAPDAALAIAPCNAVHTFFMRFPIDIVFVSRDGVVVKISPDVAAWRLAASLRAYATIELAAGAAARAGLAVGDTLAVVRAKGKQG